MLKPEQVPPEVVKRFATWQFPKCTDKLMRSMLADAINAWPGIIRIQETNGLHQECWLQLPLQRKGGDE